MAFVNYPSSSPYASTPQLSWRIGRYVHRSIPRATDDLVVVVQPKHARRPDSLAYDLYGSAAFWWVFGETNPKLRLDPIRDLLPGMALIVPTKARLMRLLGS